jgi:hypothetical protein
LRKFFVRRRSIHRRHRHRRIDSARFRIPRGDRAGASTRRVRGLFQAFPVIAAHSKGASFAFCAGMVLLQFIAAFFFMRERRGIAFESMSDLLRAPPGRHAPQYVNPGTAQKRGTSD